MSKSGQEKVLWRRIAVAAWWLGVAALGTAIGAATGTKWQWWSYPEGFVLLRWAVYGAMAAVFGAVVAAAGALSRRQWRRVRWVVLGAWVAAAPVLATTGWWLYRAKVYPAIHDIATDTVQPPQFDKIAVLRRAGDHPTDYEGEPVARLQRQAYPDIRPLELDLPPAETYLRVLETVARLGWEVAATDPATMKVEATDQTFWFGFKDDIVIQVRLAPGGSRVDMRSASRVGRSDLGVNAERIRHFLGMIEAYKK